MAFSYRRAVSENSVDNEERSLRRRRASKTNSIFERTLNLFVGREGDNDDESPDSKEGRRDFGLSREDAWMQASFTTAALVFVFIMGCILLAVYYILEPFLHPLLWAILVGMVLHPFKHASTSEINDWLVYLDKSGLPLSLGLILSPLFLFNWLAQCFQNIFFSNWKMIVGLIASMVAMVIAYIFSLPQHGLRLLKTSSILLDTISSFMEHTGWIQICSLILGFILLVVMSNHYSSHNAALKALSVCLWFLALLNIGVLIFGSLAALIVTTLFVSVIIATLVSPTKKEFKMEVSEDKNEGLLEKGLSLEALHKLVPEDSELQANISGTDTPINIDEGDENEGGQQNEDTLFHTDQKSEAQKQVSFNPTVGLAPTMPKTQPLTGPGQQPSKRHPPHTKKGGKPRPLRGTEDVDNGRFKRVAAIHKNVLHARAQSNQVFLVLFIACVLVILWKHPIFFLIPIPLTLWCFVKWVISSAVVKNSVLNRISSFSSITKNWFASQEKILVPWPMPAMYSMYLYVDKKLLEGVKKSMGSLVSALIIVLLLVVVLAVVVLLMFQIQVELMHYASAAVSVWNTTVASNPQVKEWIGGSEGNETLQNSLENFANQNYAYAREKLGDWLHTLVSDSPSNTTIMEKRVLELIDRLYSVYVVSNITAAPAIAYPTEGAPETDLLANKDDSILWTFLPLVNIDTALTVLKSVWLILSDNLAVALSFLYTSLELLFSGGTVLINSIVFLTALFYLLSYSDQDYLPVKWVMDFLPQLTASKPAEAGDGGGESGVGGNEDYGNVFSRAIRSVFHATLRRAFFYGLYIWLIHTLFGLPVSVLPAVLAGLAGAIPFVGAYWVALPAVLELWLLQGQLLSALALCTLSVVPVFFVDTLINREIEGGHPYLTGLAIAGGIYFAGLEGVLIGPILLSCLLFVVDYYDTSFMYS